MATRPRLNRARAIREFCLEDKLYHRQWINVCCHTSCPFWAWRRGEGAPDGMPVGNRAECIRKVCLACMGGQLHMINNCSDRACPLWEWRRGEGSPEWTVAPLRRQIQRRPSRSTTRAFRRVLAPKSGAERPISDTHAAVGVSA